MNPIMKNNLRDLQQVQKASGKTVAQCRAALDAAKGDVADAIELLSRRGNIATDTPVDDTDWFTSPPLTRTALEETQAQLGFKLPQAYIDLQRVRVPGHLQVTQHVRRQRRMLPAQRVGAVARTHQGLCGGRQGLARQVGGTALGEGHGPDFAHTAGAGLCSGQ